MNKKRFCANCNKRIVNENCDRLCQTCTKTRPTLQTRGRTQGGSDVKVTLFGNSSKVIGHGAFGTIYKVKTKVEGETPEFIALKEPAKKDDREADLVKGLRHPNMVRVKFSLEKKGVRFLAMELMEDGDLYQFIKQHYDERKGLGIFCEVFAYQMFRGLGYLHLNRIVHRDIKPENLLVSGSSGRLKICDFGCAKRMHRPEERSACCVGTKEFRAPELLFHHQMTTDKVDIWSGIVVLTEMIDGGEPLFGEGPRNEEHQLLRIASYLGPPTVDYNAHTERIKKLYTSKHGTSGHLDYEDLYWHKPLHDFPSCMDLLRRNLVYEPSDRMTAFDICAHKYFARLHDSSSRLPNGHPLPANLFSFSRDEISHMSSAAKATLLKPS